MTSAGIDIGAKATKVVILKDGQVLSRHMVLAGFDTDESAKQALGEALRQAGLSRDDLEHITATGTDRKQASFGLLWPPLPTIVLPRLPQTPEEHIPFCHR